MSTSSFWSVDATYTWHFISSQPLYDGQGRACGTQPWPSCNTVVGRLVGVAGRLPSAAGGGLTQVCPICREAATRRIVESTTEEES